VLRSGQAEALKLAVVTSHPIQYHSPWFRAMAGRPGLDLEVFFCHLPSPAEHAAAGFRVEFEWDTALLDGFRYRLLQNVATNPSISRFSGLDTPEISAILSKGQYDAVLLFGWSYKSAWQAIGACWRNKIPVLVRSDSHLHTDRRSWKRLLKALPYRCFIPKLDACLAVGQWSAEYFRHYGARPERVFIVPHTVDPSFERDSRAWSVNPAQVRDRWGLSPADTIFLFVGKFTAIKRPVDFIRGILAARKRCARIGGIMVGDGPLREHCQRLVEELRLPIGFTGFLNQSEIATAYSAADVLVVPSGQETWGLVVNEAMSCGRPSLVSDRVGCGPDLVSSGACGFVFPMGDVEALASRMVDCASRPELVAVMGEKARALAARFSVTAAVESLMQALSRVVTDA
jgi:glycosyltransferase involved in cell wall biosynthesis